MTAGGSEWRSHSDWIASARAVTARESALAASAQRPGDDPRHCVLCRQPGRFRHIPGTSAREGHVCDGCGCNARQRAVANILLDAIPDHASARVYLTEQASPFYVAMRRHVPGTRGSEFGAGRLRRMRLAAWLARHGRLERIRLEDVRALSFADASLDAVVSQDVLEHVADHRDALREAARVLRPGGVLVLSVPFYDTALRSEQIAWPDGRGGVRFAGEPEFHGDPVGGGVACFHHFGWDLLQDMRDAGFADACACRVHGPGVGLPEAQWVLRAVR